MSTRSERVETPRVVTSIMLKGMGSSSALVTMGYTLAPLIEFIVTTFKKGRTKTRELVDSALDIYTVSAMLLSVNGDEIVSPSKKLQMGAVDHDKEISVGVSDLRLEGVINPITRIFINAIRVIRGRSK